MGLPHIPLPKFDTMDFDTLGSIEPILIKIPDNLSGMRLDIALATIIPELSRSRLTNWIKQKQILVNNHYLKPKDKIVGGEEIMIMPSLSPEVLAHTAENIPLNVIYEDAHLIIINKPAGLTVHPGNGNWSGTLLNALLYHYPQLKNIPRAGIVHRLDKDTTGLMVIAKSMLAQTKLVQQLQARKVSRIYRAIVEGNPLPSGIINQNIGRDPYNRTKMAVLAVGGKQAITHYKVLHYFKQFSYLECRLETGRTHQIRVHLKSLGHPLAGDLRYGSRKINYTTNIVNAIQNLNRQALHALKLSFFHPLTDELIQFQVPLPLDFKHLLANLYEEANQMDSMDINDFTEDAPWEIIYAK